MDCLHVRPMLSAFHDNEISPAGRAEVEAHLQRCPSCARILAAMERLDANVEVPEPGPEYWDRFNRRVEDRIEGQPAVPGKVVSPPRRDWMKNQWSYLIPAAAAAILVVWIVRFSGMSVYSPVSPEPQRVEKKSDPAAGRPAAAPAEKKAEPARRPAEKTSPLPAPVPPPASASAGAEKEISGKPERTVEPSTRVPESSSVSPGADTPKTATRFRATADRAEVGTRLGAAEDRREETLRKEAAKPEAAGSVLSDTSCDDARRLAASGRFRDAEASQRACLASDISSRAQEDGLVFLAELLDRQTRFNEADAVIEETRARFPDSRALDLYRRQRPQVQSGELPFPATQR